MGIKPVPQRGLPNGIGLPDALYGLFGRCRKNLQFSPCFPPALKRDGASRIRMMLCRSSCAVIYFSWQFVYWLRIRLLREAQEDFLVSPEDWMENEAWER